MHLGSLESTQKARVALGCASSYSYAFFVLSKLPKCIRTRYTHAKHEQILNWEGRFERRLQTTSLLVIGSRVVF